MDNFPGPTKHKDVLHQSKCKQDFLRFSARKPLTRMMNLKSVERNMCVLLKGVFLRMSVHQAGFLTSIINEGLLYQLYLPRLNYRNIWRVGFGLSRREIEVTQ